MKEFNAKAVDIIGGLIAENKDGTVRVDYGFDTMLQNIKENELQSINKVLFGYKNVRTKSKKNTG